MSAPCIAKRHECTTPDRVYFYVSTVWLSKQRSHKYPKTSTTHWNKLWKAFISTFIKNRQNKDHLNVIHSLLSIIFWAVIRVDRRSYIPVKWKYITQR